MTDVTDRERRLVAALADDPVYSTDHQLELAFGPRVGRVVAEMRRAVRDHDAEKERIDALDDLCGYSCEYTRAEHDRYRNDTDHDWQPLVVSDDDLTLREKILMDGDFDPADAQRRGF